jgi:hypothetical protein
MENSLVAAANVENSPAPLIQQVSDRPGHVHQPKRSAAKRNIMQCTREWFAGQPGEYLTSSLTSMVVHLLLLLFLALWWRSLPWDAQARQVLTLAFTDETTALDLSPTISTQAEDDTLAEDPLAGTVIQGLGESGSEIPEPSPVELAATLAPRLAQADTAAANTSVTKLADNSRLPYLGGLSGSARGERRSRARELGATDASEAAVERALAWLAAHQRADGSWRFDHLDGACDGTCRNPGTHASTTAATALALLAFYGANYDHKQGRYATVVNKGLYYLGGRMLLTPQGGDLQEGTMYAQGMAAITLSEAAALTNDATLRGYAERAIEFIRYAQDRHGGGWRYLPGEPGDTTVTGWQLMALKSGQLAGIEIPSTVFQDASKFLDSVQSQAGAAYGYRDRARRDSTTAVGLLCRMYLGWSREHPALAQGVQALDKSGPSKHDQYYNYYATQVMLHYGGEPWERWNARLRDQLIAAQETTGHSAGSWYFPNKHSDQGGRLLNTVLATLTLEVYYRHQPLYQPQAAESGF